MADITEIKLPDATVFTVKDLNAQPKTLATPLTINGTQETTVEDALDGLNDYSDALKDNLAANEESGAKNLLENTANSNSINGITFTVNPDKTITATGTASADAEFKLAQLQSIYIESNTDYILSGCPTGGAANKWFLEYTNYYNYAYKDTGDGVTVNKFDTTTYPNQRVNIVVKSGTALPVGGITFKPMLRDSRIVDDTFVPFAKTNLQLTNDKAERNDLATIHATGSTNTTGAQIDAGTFFYLNGQFCKALTNIAANATFTENTNYKKDTVGEEVSKIVQTDDFGHGITKVFSAKRGCLIIISRQSDGIFFIGQVDTADTVSSIVSVGMSNITITYSAGTVSIINQSGTTITATVIGGYI